MIFILLNIYIIYNIYFPVKYNYYSKSFKILNIFLSTIHSKKTAILYNGIWHYKKITKTHSLEQTRARDEIKTKVIQYTEGLLNEAI